MKASLLNRHTESVIVTDISSLQHILTRPPQLWPRSKILLQLEGLTASETESWQRTLNSHFSACGCKTGTILMALAIELYVLFLSLSMGDVSRLTWLHFVAGGLIGLLGALAGKILGLGWARYQFKKTVARLSLRLTEDGMYVDPIAH